MISCIQPAYSTYPATFQNYFFMFKLNSISVSNLLNIVHEWKLVELFRLFSKQKDVFFMKYQQTLFNH